jgi:hypothetical protein
MFLWGKKDKNGERNGQDQYKIIDQHAGFKTCPDFETSSGTKGY